MLDRIAAKLAVLKQDRGEGPVPYIILVSLVVVVALAVAGAIAATANNWIADLTSNMP